MKKARFTEEQIIGFLREQEAGMTTAEVCRRHGFSEATFYKWKSKYGGLEVSEAKRLKALEDENNRLKRLLADAMLDNVVLGSGCLEEGNPADGLYDLVFILPTLFVCLAINISWLVKSKHTVNAAGRS